MLDINNHFWRYVLGILLGMALLLVIFILFPKVSLTISNDDLTGLEKIQKQLLSNSKKDTSQILVNLTNLRTAVEVSIEKVNSLNSRFGDFYIFTGIIITLLLAINVSVYLRTAHEVEKHMTENFEKYRKRILEFEEESEKSFGKIKIFENLSEQLTKNIDTNTPQL